MKTDLTPDEWLTKPAAARLLGTSIRTIERHIAAHRIGTRPDAATGRPLCNPEDVRKLLPSWQPALFAPAAERTTPAATAAPAELLSALLTTLRRPQPAGRFLTLEDAAGRCGLSSKFLGKAIRAGQLRALRDGRQWKVHSKSLTRFLAQLSDEE